ncbi:serine/threonine-protein kinase [[Mycobacterium] nativiensis]|uniref:non-specific serine/threonine protein kinase n=1 Tax=[Mycobacterium] nativiensis TaxID=2855503 RepID=A0ABU5XZW3_9MYCO|nr:serine/threonine-protein kinase [Mycolicibacter sp. MYC340]MEB3033307.1 serine/threonine-protein kinase [Mycolicibacter sp. MYC340]
MTTPEPADMPPTHIAGYRIERPLAAGGMGAVYLVHSPSLPRTEALKVLSSELARDAGMRARFLQEADISARLDHPNIVHVFSRGETEEGQLWIALEYVPGTDAETALRTGPMPPPRAAHIITEAARALDYAHRHGIVHQDIKPANLLLSPQPGEPERVVISDFGAALTPETSDTADSPMTASLAYAAPEVITGKPVDGRADIYSLGCTLFRLLTGRYPFPVHGVSGMAKAHLDQPPPRISEYLPGAPRQLDHVITKALAKDPTHRHATAGDFANEATAAIRQIPALLPHEGPHLPPPAHQFPGPHRPPLPAPPPAPNPAAVQTPEPAAPATERTRQPDTSWPPVDFVGHLPHTQADISLSRRKIGAAVAGILAGVGLIVWLALPSSAPRPDSPAAATAPAPTTSPEPDATALATLRRLIPAGYQADSCRPSDTDTELAAVTVVCEPNSDPGGPTEARYTLALSRNAVQALFAREVATATPVICPGNIQSPGPWHRADNPTIAQGTVFCGRRHDHPIVAWTTEDKLFTATVESRADSPTLTGLYTWWRTHS